MKECILPMGPQHPALDESLHFKFKVDGEVVQDLDIRMGYVHRAIEKSLENRDWFRNITVAQRICGLCSIAHSTAYVQGVEKIMGEQIPERVKHIRLIMTELSRIQSHLFWAGIAAYEIGFETLFMYCFREREYALDTIETICGKRVHYDINSLGGLRRDIPKSMHPQILENLEKIESGIKRYKKVFFGDSSVMARINGKGILKTEDAKRFCTVGPHARASGVKYDVREASDYLIYNELNFKPVVEEGGDVLARVRVRLKEIYESIRLIRAALDSMPSGDIRGHPEWVTKIPAGEAVSRVEAPRGELFYYIKSTHAHNPYRVKIRTPTLANFASLKTMLVGETIADIPIIVASIDPCISCTERMEVFDISKQKTKIISADELRKWRKENV